MLFQLCVWYKGQLIFEQTSSDYSLLIETLNDVIRTVYNVSLFDDVYNIGSVIDTALFKYEIKEV